MTNWNGVSLRLEIGIIGVMPDAWGDRWMVRAHVMTGLARYLPLPRFASALSAITHDANPAMSSQAIARRLGVDLVESVAV